MRVFALVKLMIFPSLSFLQGVAVYIFLLRPRGQSPPSGTLLVLLVVFLLIYHIVVVNNMACIK